MDATLDLLQRIYRRLNSANELSILFRKEIESFLDTNVPKRLQKELVEEFESFIKADDNKPIDLKQFALIIIEKIKEDRHWQNTIQEIEDITIDARLVIDAIRSYISKDARLISSFKKEKNNIDILIPNIIFNSELKFKLFSLLETKSSEDINRGWKFHNTMFGDVNVFYSIQHLSKHETK